MRVVLVVVCAACALWVMAGVDLGGLTPAVEAAAPDKVAVPSEATIVRAHETPSDGVHRVEQAPHTLAKLTPPETATPSTTRALSLGELGEGALSPEFRDLAQRYTEDVHDDASASQLEAELRGSLAEAGVGRQLEVLHCRAQVCRLLFDDVSSDQVRAMLELPALHRLAGVGPETPYSLRAGQFELYFIPGGTRGRDDHDAARARVRAPTQKL